MPRHWVGELHGNKQNRDHTVSYDPYFGKDLYTIQRALSIIFGHQDYTGLESSV